jgi:hypothetical protein
MFQGFHRLQICSNWTHRTKVTNLIWIQRVNSDLTMDSNWTHKIIGFIGSLDSTHSKDSNEVSFVIFGSTEQKLWFFKDLDQIWFENLFEICSGSDRATWRYGIRWYRFVRIKNWGRWIWVDVDARDQSVPVRLVILSGALDRDLTVTER